ncbi:MAG: mechanosensitive ion channel family protein [Dehalococcoidia bacterium]|nr:mechanosensitive ion channel family protein [Dehalococcoidia bacterium]
MRELFGNPSDGSFLAWVADEGIWAGLIALAALIVWFILRIYLHRLLRSGAAALEEQGMGHVSDRVQSSVLFLSEGPMLLILVGVPFGLWIAHVLDQNVSPIWDAIGEGFLSVGEGIQPHVIPIVVIWVVAYVAIRLLKRLVPPAMDRLVMTEGEDPGLPNSSSNRAQELRAQTLSGVIVYALAILVWAIAIFSVLSEIGVPIGPMIAGFGIAGIAVGFGAQSMVKDMIAGFFIVAENQYRTGDVVSIAGIAGSVESINLRRTVLRDLDGKVHVVPNGEISVASNYTKFWSRINLNVGVAYKENMDHVFEILNEIGMELSGEDYWEEKIIDPPQVLRLDSFDDSQITIKMLGVCRPLTQWEIAGELRKRIKDRFDAEGIEIPFPHQTIYWGVGAHPSRGNQGSEDVHADAETLQELDMPEDARREALRESALTAEAERRSRPNPRSLERLTELDDISRQIRQRSRPAFLNTEEDEDGEEHRPNPRSAERMAELDRMALEQSSERRKVDPDGVDKDDGDG